MYVYIQSSGCLATASERRWQLIEKCSGWGGAEGDAHHPAFSCLKVPLVVPLPASPQILRTDLTATHLKRLMFVRVIVCPIIR